MLSLMEMKDCNPKFTPVDNVPLGKDEDGNPCWDHWECRSFLDMLLYLVGSTRPDIAYDAHQCVRFSNNPKQYHDVGLKHISKYVYGD